MYQERLIIEESISGLFKGEPVFFSISPALPIIPIEIDEICIYIVFISSHRVNTRGGYPGQVSMTVLFTPFLKTTRGGRSVSREIPEVVLVRSRASQESCQNTEVRNMLRKEVLFETAAGAGDSGDRPDHGGGGLHRLSPPISHLASPIDCPKRRS